jgi:DNA-binding IclR family transcriptional regulator
MKADGMGPTEIAEALKIGRASVYRVLARLNLSLLLAEFRDRRLAESRRSSWYPTMRIFQQGAVGDWNGALDRLRQELIGVARRGARRL